MTAPPRQRPLRSILFAPGDDERKLRRAAESGADAIVADLEDAVARSAKDDARELTRRVFREPGGEAARFIRVNAAGTPWFEADLALVGELAPDAVVLPKATPEAVDALASSGSAVIAIVETAMGVRLAFETASRPNVLALLLGAADLGAQLGLSTREDSLEIHYARSKLVIDSAAAAIRAPIDVVHLAIGDLDGLAAQAQLARSMGLRGKACIHPAHVATINAVFTPSTQELDWAQRVLSAAGEAAAQGRGAVNLDGSMVDAAVLLRAQRIVAESEGGS